MLVCFKDVAIGTATSRGNATPQTERTRKLSCQRGQMAFGVTGLIGLARIILLGCIASTKYIDVHGAKRQLKRVQSTQQAQDEM